MTVATGVLLVCMIAAGAAVEAAVRLSATAFRLPRCPLLFAAWWVLLSWNSARVSMSGSVCIVAETAAGAVWLMFAVLRLPDIAIMLASLCMLRFWKSVHAPVAAAGIQARHLWKLVPVSAAGSSGTWAFAAAMAHSSAPPCGDVASPQRERDPSDSLCRIGGAAVMLFQAKEAADALMVEYRLPAPPPRRGEALAGVRHSRHLRDVLVRLGGAVVMQAMAQQTLDSLVEEHQRVWAPRAGRTARSRSPRRSSQPRQPRASPGSAAGSSSPVARPPPQQQQQPPHHPRRRRAGRAHRDRSAGSSEAAPPQRRSGRGSSRRRGGQRREGHRRDSSLRATGLCPVDRKGCHFALRESKQCPCLQTEACGCCESLQCSCLQACGRFLSLWWLSRHLACCTMREEQPPKLLGGCLLRLSG